VDITLPADIRPAHSREIDPALRLLLCSASGAVDEAQLREFTRLAKTPGDNLGGLWVAAQGDHLITALLPVVSPGRTLLLFLPGHLFSEYQATVTRQLIQTICRRASEADLHLAQCLLDVHDTVVTPLLRTCSFERLAELLYLQATIGRGIQEAPLPASYRWETYSPRTHELFATTILSTYQHSLDCPRLNGLRSIDDILAGHRATGHFDPAIWFVLLDHHTPLGALLLTHLSGADLIELVYLGLAPGSRGRGIGDILMRRAAAAVAARKGGRLSLAVDAGNLPALKLYWRHGLQVIGRKLAYLRDLRADHQSPPPTTFPQIVHRLD
jgi:ribosomal protein S18 acetylase RimI-like enzyme